MSYTKSTDFAAKDALLTGDPNKKIKGSEIDTEFNNIATADAQNVKLTEVQTLTNKTLTSPVINTGDINTPDIDGGTIDGTTQASGTINGPIAAGGTWTAAATWTLPAHTLGGTVTSNGQSFSGTIANLGTVTTADINGGTIDGTVIGGASAAAITGTTITATTQFSGPHNGTVGATTPAAGTFTTLTSTGNAALGDAEASDTHAIKGATTLLANSASAALDITQTGSGHALVVRDEAADATAFSVTGDGLVGIGKTTPTSSLDAVGTLFRFSPNTDLGTEGVLWNGSSSKTTWRDMYAFRNQIDGTDRFYVRGDGRTQITNDSASAALTVTQTGSGNAFVVEDSASTDSTPFVIDASGNHIIGHTALITASQSTNSVLQIHGTTGSLSSAALTRWSADANPQTTIFQKSRGASAGTRGIVSSGDDICRLEFAADDGTNFIPAVQILAEVDGTPGTNDMPGRLVFSTTRDGASSPTEAIRIDATQSCWSNSTGTGTNSYGFGVSASLTGATNNYGFYSNIASGTGRWNFYANGTADNYFAGRTLIGTVANNAGAVEIGSNITGATTAYGVTNYGVVQSGVTASAQYFTATMQTAASAFTLTDLIGFRATQGTIGATSAVTNQYGFLCSGTMVGATNNYGFYSNIASGTGRWNFYAAGTADNYFAGSVGIGTTPGAGIKVLTGGNLDGSASAGYANRVTGTFQSTASTIAISYSSSPSVAAGAYSNLQHFRADQGTITGTLTNQVGFLCASLTGATNNYGFQSALTAGTGVWNFYASGTASNYFAGLIDISASTAGQIKFPATQNASADANTLDDYREATFTATATGMTTSPTGTASFVRVGNAVTLTVPTITGTSNATSFTLTGMPTTCRPGATRTVIARVQDNGGAIDFGRADIDSSGVITLYKDAASTAFTNSGTKSVNVLTVSYHI